MILISLGHSTYLPRILLLTMLLNIQLQKSLHGSPPIYYFKWFIVTSFVSFYLYTLQLQSEKRQINESNRHSWLTYFNYLNCKLQLLIQIGRNRQSQSSKGTSNKFQEEFKGFAFTKSTMDRSLLTSYLLKLSNYSISLTLNSLEEGHGWKSPGRRLTCGHGQPVWTITHSWLIWEKGMHVILWPNVLLRDNHLRVQCAFLAYLRRNRFLVVHKGISCTSLNTDLSFFPLKFQ